MLGDQPQWPQGIHPSKTSLFLTVPNVIHRASVNLLTHLSSSRHEYRPWTGVRPAKSARRNPPAQYSSPGTEATHVPRETSYQAAYRGEGHRSIGLHQGEHIIPSASTNIQPTAVPQPIPTALQAGTSQSPSGLQQSVPSERTELSGTTKGEVSAGRDVVHHAVSSIQLEETHHAKQPSVQRVHWKSYRFKLQHAPPESHLHSSPRWPVAVGASQKSDTAFCPWAAQSDPAV